MSKVVDEFNKNLLYILNCAFQKLSSIELMEQIKLIKVIIGNDSELPIKIIGKILYEIKDLIKEKDLEKFLQLDFTENPVLDKFKTHKKSILRTIEHLKKFAVKVHENEQEKTKFYEVLTKLCVLYAKYYTSI